jgi:hypothetical protein
MNKDILPACPFVSGGTDHGARGTRMTKLRPTPCRYGGYPIDNGIAEGIDRTIARRTECYGAWGRIFVTLPPFHWRVPSGLDPVTTKWFWKQKQNIRRFLDTRIPVTGLVRVVNNGLFCGHFSGSSSQTHYKNLSSAPCHTDAPEYECAMYIERHEVEYFQHFLDNGIPHIALMLLATGVHPGDVTLVMSGWTTQTIPEILARWGFRTVVARSGPVSARTLILPETVPHVHPLYYQQFRDGMGFDHDDADRIVLVSRTSADTAKRSRLLLNQAELEEALRARFGPRFVLFRPREASFSEAVDVFQKAAMVIGVHGGAMYNAMFSSPSATVVEVMPVRRNGLYRGQLTGRSIPSFAHLAMYTNALLMGQEFFRFYAVGGASFSIVVDRFMAWLESVPAALARRERRPRAPAER